MQDVRDHSCPISDITKWKEQIVFPEKEREIIVISHSCGYMEPFIGDLIECGADVINPLQTVNDHGKVLEKYGSKVVFDGCMDGMVHLEEVTEEDLRREVRRAIDQFGPYKSIIVSSRPMIPKNGEIVNDEARKYGRGFYNN